MLIKVRPKTLYGVCLLVAVYVLCGMQKLNEPNYRIHHMSNHKKVLQSQLDEFKNETFHDELLAEKTSEKIQQKIQRKVMLKTALQNLSDVSKTAASKFISAQNLTEKPKLIVVRYLSNDLPPLHGKDQTYINTETILKEEELPLGFERLWILSGIVERAKEAALEALLKSHHQWYHVIPVPKTSDVEKLQMAALNVNKARNTGLQMGFESGAEWVILLDGCSFVTQESYDSIRKNLIKKTNYIFYYIPMVRLHRRITIGAGLIYRGLFHVTSGQQECQIAINREYLLFKQTHSYYKNQAGLLFDETRPYAIANKLTLLNDTYNLFPSGVTLCRDVYVGTGAPKASNLITEGLLMSRCGYIIRLLYYPEDQNQTHSLSNFQRFLRRTLSTELFMSKLKHLADEFERQQQTNNISNSGEQDPQGSVNG